jgi:amino acid adenylation domain-containing protein
MQTNVLEYLEGSARRVPDKVAFADVHTQLTFRQVYERSRGIGSRLLALGAAREPVIVYMGKSPDTLAAFWGVIYAGCYYVPIDEEMPRRRMELILENTQAKYLIYDEGTKEKLPQLHFDGETVSYEEAKETAADEAALGRIRENALDVDPIYVVFTSGSTGTPKGVVGHHRGVIDYVENLSQVLQFDEESVFASQTPFYLDACLKEVYGTVKCGAQTWLVPKEYFMQPVKLVEFLNEHQVNTICWVVSALTMISAFGTFDLVRPQFLHTIAFGSEVFPIKQFNLWKETLPDAQFYNLYGPTEATGMSCYYHATRLFEEHEVIPIGRPFPNTQILLLDENGHEARDGAQGEICIRGTCLTHGYYHNPEKTNEVFTQNPQNRFFPDRIYHTGDLAYRDAQGELCFVSRADYQIKHMGHRIELGEIEADVNQIDGIYTCCCIFIKESKKIVLFYAGKLSKKDLTIALRERLPRYMIPNAVMQMDALPLTPNGKMDRLRMETIYQEQKKGKIRDGLQ